MYVNIICLLNREETAFSSAPRTGGNHDKARPEAEAGTGEDPQDCD